jgi:hypothetical protein
MPYTIHITKDRAREHRLSKFLHQTLYTIQAKRNKYALSDEEILRDLEQYFKDRLARILEHQAQEKQKAHKIRDYIKQLQEENNDGV